MKKFAVIVAGGKGSRMQSELPKQFLLLLDTPILMHSIERFAMANGAFEIVVVLPEDQIPFWNSMCSQMDFDIEHKVVSGGEHRYESVKNGLAACEGDGLVAIHDGVRPLVSPDLIKAGLKGAEKHGSAIPVLPVKQSLRKVSDTHSEAVDRAGFHTVQTPQCFKIADLKSCYDQPFSESFTDDASVYESMGNQVHLIEGEETNLKVTTPIDIKLAETYLKMSRR